MSKETSTGHLYGGTRGIKPGPPPETDSELTGMIDRAGPDTIPGTDDVETVKRQITAVNTWLDSAQHPDYRAQPLANTWRRVTKVCEESGEVWRALSAATGDNPRKGTTGSYGDVCDELADCMGASLGAIMHLTGDAGAAWDYFLGALAKAADRAARAGYPADDGEPSGPVITWGGGTFEVSPGDIDEPGPGYQEAGDFG